MEKQTKIVILSDNHFQKKEMLGILSKHADADVFIHCGDSQYQPTDVIFNGVNVVKGNNDFTKFPNEILLDIAGRKVLITHGHIQYVYYDSKPNTRGTDELVAYAKQQGADIVFYGHTHVAECHEQDGVFVLNPGSTNFPRSYTYRVPSYAVVTLEGDSIKPQFFQAKTHEEITADII